LTVADAPDNLDKRIWKGARLSMDQMNVSITEQLAGYVRKKVKSGRYNNASEVVREALRRMEDDDQRALRLAKPSVDDILTDLTAEQLDGIRGRVRADIESLAAGRFVEYQGRAGLTRLADGVKARGRKLLAQETTGK
jgi:putative addiction module CopG family antidote